MAASTSLLSAEKKITSSYEKAMDAFYKAWGEYKKLPKVDNAIAQSLRPK